MGNLFDGFRDAAYNMVLNTMGQTATWAPSNGSPPQTAVVLFNQPTAKDDFGNDDFNIVTTRCEFPYNVLPGLFEAVQAGNSELINIAGLDFYAFKADRKYDGQTIVLQLEPKR